MTQDGKTILVVDDEAMIRSLARKILDRAGYVVVLASTGDEGLTLLRSRPAEIDLAILDYTVEGLSGFDLMSALREVLPRLPIIISSGEVVRLEDLPPELLHNTSILLKPYAAFDLTEAVRVALEAGRFSD